MSTPHEPPQKKKTPWGKAWGWVKREWRKAVREVREGVQETQKRMKERDEWLVEKCRQNSIGELGRWFDTVPSLILFVLLVYGVGGGLYWTVGYFFPDVFSEVGTGLTDADRTGLTDADGADTRQEKPSEILRNRFWIVWMVATATFATAGIWFTNRARRNREKGLANEQQRLNSERFQRAVEMLANKDQLTTRLGGLYILRDLAREDPEQEHIRCLDIVSGWLREKHPAPPNKNEKEPTGTFVVSFQNSSFPQSQNKSDYILAISLLNQKNWSDAQKDTAEQHRRHDKKGAPNNHWPRLYKINFSHAHMQNFDFNQADLTRANLQKANLQGINLQGAHLIWVDLSRTRLRGAKLQGADLSKTDLQGANLQGADLHKASLYGADLQGADLQKANLQGAHLQGANLQGANLQGADLQGANLHRVNLTREDLGLTIHTNLNGDNLQGTDLQGAKLQGANLSKAKLYGANLHEADLSKANLQGAIFQGAHLFRTDLQGADLQGADLSRTNLQGANLQGAHLHKASLYDADLQGASLLLADISDADLRDVEGLTEGHLKSSRWDYGNPPKHSPIALPESGDPDLQGAILRGAILRGANLHRADLQGANLRGTNLEGADLNEADLTKANLSRANLHDVKNLTKEQLESARWVKPPRYSPIPLPHDGTGSSDKK